jgi:hypothetical protein
LTSADFQFLCKVLINQPLKVSVDCGKADSGQASSDPVVEFVCSRVGGYGPQLLKDNFPLLRYSHSVLIIEGIFHADALENNNSYYNYND